MDEIIKFLDKKRDDIVLLDKLYTVIGEHLEQEQTRKDAELNTRNKNIEEINNMFTRSSAYHELKDRCNPDEKLLITLQHYDSGTKGFLYTIKIQTQSISRMNLNGNFTYYINDKLFVTGNELFNLKLEHLKPREHTMFSKFHARFCTELNSEIEENEFYLLLIDVVITFGEFLGQL